MHGMKNNPLKTLLDDKGIRLADLARAADVEKSTVTRWASGRIPAERVLEVERITGISRTKLRPDLYPAEASA